MLRRDAAASRILAGSIARDGDARANYEGRIRRYYRQWQHLSGKPFASRGGAECVG